jgi:hypothetical protein
LRYRAARYAPAPRRAARAASAGTEIATETVNVPIHRFTERPISLVYAL